MVISSFELPDYRYIAWGGISSRYPDDVRIREVNVVGKKWNLRIVWPRLGFSLWRGHRQILKFRYPEVG